MMAAPVGIVFPPSILNTAISSTFRPVAVNLVSRGLFTGKQIVDGPVYQVWQATVEFPALRREQWQELESVIARAYDNRTPFRIFDPLRQSPLGAFGNTGTGSGTTWGDDTPWGDGSLWSDRYYDGLAAAENAPAGRDSLLLGGAPAGQARVIVQGDIFEVNGFLYEAVNTADADADGKARVTVRPRLREAVVVGDQIIAGRPSGSFYVSDAGSFVMTRNSFTRRAPSSLSFTEALP